MLYIFNIFDYFCEFQIQPYTLMKFLLYAVIIYLGLLVLLYFFQRSLIYFPDNHVYSPDDAGVPEMHIIELPTVDGLKIKAWYLPPSEPSRPTILYFHGNAGNIANRGFIVRPFIDKGYGVLLLTYRGYSGNPGKPSEEGLYNDARAAMQFLENEKVSPHCIVLYGNSIGAAIAIQMATEYSVGALVLQSPFSTLTDVAQVHYAFFMPFKGLINDKYDSMSKVKSIYAPVYILHGKSDNIIPPELSRKLFDAIGQPKEAKYLPNRGHNDLFEPGLVINFIKKYVKCKSVD